MRVAAILNRPCLAGRSVGEGLHANAAVVTFLLGAAALVAAFALPAIPWRMAVGFVGPEAFVWMKSSIWPSLPDFPTSALAYDASLVMRSYVWAKEALDLSPTRMAGVHVTLQALLFTYAAWRTGFALSGNAAAAMLVAGVILVSPLTGANLGRFGDGLQGSIHALYYGYANAFCLLALAFRVEQRHLAAAVALLGCGLCHPTIGLYAGVFLALSLWTHLCRLPDLRTLWPYATTAAAMGIWILASRPPDPGDAVPADAFIRATRTFSAHWHPLQLEIFTRSFYANTAPLLFSLAALIVAWPTLSGIHDRVRSSGLGTGIVGMLAISAAGILFTDVWPVKVIVELCAQRGSFVVTLLAGVIAAIYLWRKLLLGDRVESAMAVLALAALATPSNGMAVLPWASLAVLQWWREGERQDITRVMRLGAALVLLAPIAVVEPTAMPAGSAKAIYLLPVLVLFATIAVLSRRVTRQTDDAGRQHPVMPWTVALALLITVAIGRYDSFAGDQRAYGKLAPDVFAAQSWVRDNTRPDALIMVDPSFIYGWRDYAQRASFGTYREWGLFGFIYGGNAAAYEEGLRRFALFGIDPVAIAEDHERRGLPMRRADRAIKLKIEKFFNQQPLKALFNIAMRESVDYLLIYSDRFAGDRGDAKPVFQNAAIEIYAVPPAG